MALSFVIWLFAFYPGPYHSLLLPLWPIAEFIDDHEGAVTALGTLAIAAFTLTLWQSTQQNANAFMNAERPHVLVPERHTFLLFAAPITDWVFKLIAWLGIAATFSIAAEKTGNSFLIVVARIATFLPSWFLYEFLLWLSSPKRNPRPASAVPSAFRRFVNKFRGLLVAVAAFLIWWSLVIAAHAIVQQIIQAIAEFQKAAR